MDDASRHRRYARRRQAGRAVTLAIGACLVMSCSAENSGRDTEPDRQASGSSTSPGGAASRSPSSEQRPTPGGGLTRLPKTPATRDAATLARQITRTTTTLRDRDAPAAEVRRAAEFQQLAVHTLATAPGAYRREVTTRLRPEPARVTRSNVEAARSLHALTDPARTLPRWRIVAPPPATELVGYYRRAQRRTDVPWNYLAAIHLVETRMGRIRGTSTAGARGPMQFLPSTWDLYGAGGDINDPRDAILAAGRLLEDNGAPDRMAAALRAYNPSDHYVRAVSEHARTMRRSRTAYRAYWHWRVLYRHTRGTYVLPVGYPDARARPVPAS